MAFKTSRNLTVVGIASLLVALGSVAVALFDGDPNTNPDWGTTFAALSAALAAIMAKGAASTGGTVDAAGKPVL